MRKWTIRIGHWIYESTNALEAHAFAYLHDADSFKSKFIEDQTPIDYIMPCGMVPPSRFNEY